MLYTAKNRYSENSYSDCRTLEAGNIKTENKQGLRIKRLNSIYQISQQEWDSISSDVFHSHNFLKAIEDSGIEGSKLYYLLFYNGDRLTGSAVFSSFYMSLDLLSGEIIQQWIKYIRRVWPSFLKIKMLFCGTPISIGKNNICLSDARYKREFIRHISEEMSRLARAEGTTLQCLKEFQKEETFMLNEFERYEFLQTISLPYVKLNICWNDFNSYLGSMRYKYRRQIKLSLKKLGKDKPEIIRDSFTADAQKPYLLLTDPEYLQIDIFYEQYLAVMAHTRNKLETLNKRFFINFIKQMSGHAEVLSMVYNGRTLGTAIIVNDNDKMTFLLIGLDYKMLNRFDVYFNIIYGIISLAIERKCKVLELGQTSYYIKQRCGGECIGEYFFIRSRNKIIQYLLRNFRRVIFRPGKYNLHHVFRFSSLENTIQEGA